ncbi:MAG TPA: VWA domain-containing protein [Terriglobales bacterium]|nr:VWA domain-containing protein [Terriglobales bacterium]
MNKSLISLCLFGATLSCVAQTASGGSSAPEQNALPSAPSAAIAPKAAPAPPPQEPKPSETKAAPAKPVLESLDKKKPQPVAPLDLPSDASLPQRPPQPQAPAKTDTAAPEEDLTTFVKRVEEVNVIFTVTDKRGRFIKDLRKEDFAVLDDNRPAEAVRNFSAESNLPLRVGLLVDASNSIRTQFKFEQEAAIEFLNQIIRPKIDRALVVGFDSTVEIEQDFTNDTEALSKGIRMLRPGGGTALFDAIYRVCKERLLNTRDTQTVRRAIILLSDGDDNQSRVTREEAIEMAQRAGVIIYTIGTSLSPDKGRGDKVLERIAETTGGRAFFPFKIQDVANAFSDIQDELRSQYVLAYKPADFLADGRYRSIDINTPNKKLKVRARKGYYAPRK